MHGQNHIKFDSNKVAGSVRTPLLNFSATALFPHYCLINTFSRAEMSRCTTHNSKRKYDIQRN